MTYLLLVLPFSAWAEVDQHYQNLFEEANASYKQGVYDSASLKYQEIQQAGYTSAPLLFNLGNAYFKQGAFPEAILNYERALIMDPSNPDIEFNLGMANMQIVDKVEALPGFFLSNWWKSFYRSFDLTYWSYLSIAFSLFLALSVFLFRTSGNVTSKQTYFFGGILAFLLLLVSFLAANSQYVERYKKEYAIVFASSVTLRSEPALNSSELFVLHDGTKIQILREEGDWMYVSIGDGNKGWLRSETLVRI